MRIVITGASGNAGTALLRRLAADGPHGQAHAFRPGMRLLAASAGCALAAVGTMAFLLGSTGGSPAPRITPSVDSYLLQHAYDAGQAPASSGPATAPAPGRSNGSNSGRVAGPALGRPEPSGPGPVAAFVASGATTGSPSSSPAASPSADRTSPAGGSREVAHPGPAAPLVSQHPG